MEGTCLRLLTCRVNNFGSYKEFAFDFANQGLALVYGATGSGKSTVCDMACWVLFGKTAKQGNADEVRSWQSVDEPTTGVLKVELQNGIITVTRIRGKAGQNDLYWEENGGDSQRGKDLTGTQKNLEKRLGCDADLYLTASYFSEFSSTALFFINNAKERRAIFERIANLDLPIKIAEGASNARKESKKTISEIQRISDQLTGKLSQLQISADRTKKDAELWVHNQQRSISDLEYRHKNFEKEKQAKISLLVKKSELFEQERELSLVSLFNQLEQLKNAPAGKCPTCGGNWGDKDKKQDRVGKEKKIRDSLLNVSEEVNLYAEQAGEMKAAGNHYSEQLESKRKEKNVFNKQASRSEKELRETGKELAAVKVSLDSALRRYSALNQLHDLSFALRGELLKKAVNEAEAETNRLLEKYFDAEIRVNFTLEADNLEIEIQKSGYSCMYTQLSKGQRGMLKLCFVLSIMQAASNKAGIHFANLFFDEALDGMDEALKLKTFALFQELESSHESILVIDHSPGLQSLFPKKYSVTMDNDISTMTEENE